MDEVIMYANMYGLDKTEDDLSFRMLGDTDFDLSKSDQDSLKQRSKILVENKFYLNHFYSGDLNNRDRLSVIISGLNINDVKSCRFLSPEHELTSSFDQEGNFISEQIDSYLEQFRQCKGRQSLKPLTNNKPAIKPALDLKKTIFEPLKRERKKSSEEIDDEQASKKTQKSENLFYQLTSKPKPDNLFENLIKKPQSFQQPASSIYVPVVPAPVAPAPIQVDVNKIAEGIHNEILDQVVSKMSTEILTSYSKYLIESSDLFFDLIIKENLRNCLVEEILDQQNIKSKNEALNRISVNLGEQILSECVNSIYTEYLKDLQLYESLIYDEILRCVFQKEFDIILKQIASEISADMILDQLADKIYFDTETGIFNEDLLLTLHDTIFDLTRLNLNVNTELYQEIKLCLNENLKHTLFQKWRLKLSLKLLQKQNRKSMNQTIGFMLKYASFLSKNTYKLTNLKFKLYETVHCQDFLKHLSMIRIDHRHVFMNILLENYFFIINDNTSKIYVDIPNPVQEVLIKTVLYTTRPEVYKKFFRLGQTELYETLTVNLLNPREFCVKFCLKKYQSIEDLDRTDSIIFTIENFDAKKFDYQVLKSIKHIMFISFYPREKTLNFIERILRPEQTFSLCCPDEDKDFFTIDKLYESFMREVISDRSNRAPNLASICLRDLFYETLIKFLDHTKSLMIDQIIDEFSQRFSKLISILLNKENLWSPIKEFLNEESLKFWSTKSMCDLLSNLSSLFKYDYKNQTTEYFRAFVEYIIENEKVELGGQVYTFDKLYVYADMDLVRSIDWVEKDELNRKYNLVNLKRRISSERIVKVVMEVKEEKSPKRFMMINEKVENKIEEKMKTVDSNFDSFMDEIHKEKENVAKLGAVLVDLVRDDEKKQNGLTIDENESSFDSFMRKLRDEKTCNEKFNDKLNHILWKY